MLRPRVRDRQLPLPRAVGHAPRSNPFRRGVARSSRRRGARGPQPLLPRRRPARSRRRLIAGERLRLRSARERDDAVLAVERRGLPYAQAIARGPARVGTARNIAPPRRGAGGPPGQGAPPAAGPTPRGGAAPRGSTPR